MKKGKGDSDPTDTLYCRIMESFMLEEIIVYKNKLSAVKSTTKPCH